MKKLFHLCLVLMIGLFISACNNQVKADGIYQAATSQPDDNGWTNFLVFRVEGGKIVDATYDAVNLMEGTPQTKKELASLGLYQLAPDNAGEINVQYGLIAQYLVEHQNFDNVHFNTNGTSDAISGATIVFDNITDLFIDALKAGPITIGDLPDGVHFSSMEGNVDSDGIIYTDTLGVFVSNGRILAAHVDAYKLEDNAGINTKYFKSRDESQDNNEFLTQSSLINQWIIDNQGFGSVTLDNLTNGVTNEIEGVTLPIENYLTLFNKLNL